MSEVAKALNRVAGAIEDHNARDSIAERAADVRALRDLPRVRTAMARGVAVALVRAGAYHTAIPRAAWRATKGSVVVTCNCGAEHEFAAEVAVPQDAPCGRWFMFDGRDVRVAIRPQA
jgi:hypothetical protein